MRDTSREAWAHLNESGTLAERQLAVLGVLCHREPCTATELEVRGGWKRLSELERMGLVARGPARACRVTGHRAFTWQLTGRREPLPLDPVETRPTPSQVRRAARLLAVERRYQALERARGQGQAELQLGGAIP